MTPTAQIAAIRQRDAVLNDPAAFTAEDVWESERLAEADRAELLAALDARESALRALVAQWRETAAKMPDDHELEQSVYAFDSCAYDVERLLESEP